MKSRYALPLFAVLGIMAASCMGPSVEGTWNVTPAEELPVPATIKTTFTKPDKALTVVNADISIPGITETKIQADVTMTWKIEGDTLTSAFVDSKLKSADGKEVPGFIADQAKSFVKDNIVQGTTGKLKWEGNDKFVLTLDNGKTATFDRVKG